MELQKSHRRRPLRFNSMELSIFDRITDRVTLANSDAGEFRGPGFGFVRSFLCIIIVTVVFMLSLMGVVAWHLETDVTVTAIGEIRPQIRRKVKTEINGIVAEIHVKHGQRVVKGERLVTLDDIECRTALEKIIKEQDVNHSRRIEVQNEITRQRAILLAEVERARLELDTANIELQKVSAEYRLYNNLITRRGEKLRQSVEDFLLVRLRQAQLDRAKANLKVVERRFEALGGRQQEIQTLKRQWEKLRYERQLLQHHLELTAINAPITGTVISAELKDRVGDRLQRGDTVLELAKLGDWQALLLVKENDIPVVKLNQSVRIFVNAFPHMEYKIFEGIVNEISTRPHADGSPVESIVYPVKVSVLDPEVLQFNEIYSLAYGMGVEGRIVVERRQVVDLLWRRLKRSIGSPRQHEYHLSKTRSAEQKKQGTKTNDSIGQATNRFNR